MTITSPIQRVAVALFEGFTVLDVYGPVQAFASCRTVEPDGKRRPFFEIFSMAREPGRVKAGEGPASWAEWSFEKAPDYDILLVPGGFGTRAAVADETFVERLATASRRARITTTVCTGSALLARTGLLDGRPATSNKIAWDWVVQQGPRVLWRRKARWVDDGDVLTSSGVSACTARRWRSPRRATWSTSGTRARTTTPSRELWRAVREDGVATRPRSPRSSVPSARSGGRGPPTRAGAPSAPGALPSRAFARRSPPARP